MMYCSKEARTEASEVIVDWAYQAPSLATQDAIIGISALMLNAEIFRARRQGGQTLYKGPLSKQYRRAVSDIVTIVAG